MIKIKNVSKEFTLKDKKVKALDDVSLEIHEGDIFGIIGTSGAGKSTLLRCLNLLERPDQGSIEIEGEDILALDKKSLLKKRQKIAMIFQNFNLFSQRTVFQNVAFPLQYQGKSKAEIAERVHFLLDLVGLNDKVEAYPAQLSGGQKQRVGIARALANEPDLLLCDEATSALDRETTLTVLDLLQKINQQFRLQIVLITHEQEVIKHICNKVAIIKEGRIIEQGLTFDVFASPKNPQTRSFIGDILDSQHVKESLQAYRQESPETRLLKLTFAETNANQPFISTVCKRFDVDMAILFGNIDVISQKELGVLVVSILGEDSAMQAAIAYFTQNNITVQEVNL